MGQKMSCELYASNCIPSGSLLGLTAVGCNRRAPSKRTRTLSSGDNDVMTDLSPPLLEFLLERLGSSDVDPSGQLTYSWNPVDRSPSIRIKTNDPLTLRRLPVQDTTDAIRAKVGFSRGLHAWTIQWKADQRGSHAMIGVATADAPLRALGYKCLIGNNEESWGWDIVRNRLWHNGKSTVGLICPHQQSYTPQVLGQIDRHPPSIPDEVTVILDMEGGTLSFAADGHYLGAAFRGLKGKTLYPAVSAVWGHCQVTIKYIGSVEPNPLSLSDLCRRVIRQQIGQNRLECLQSLPLPSLLIQFLR